MASYDRHVSSRTLWTASTIALRAEDFIRLQAVRRAARAEYEQACERFKKRRGIDRIDINDHAFHRATRKSYATFQAARIAERNAVRRLETAVRNCRTLSGEAPS
jgi:thymidylate kinase